MHDALRSPTKKTRTAAILRDAINNGQPLPLAVMFENMWHFRNEAERLAAIPPGDPDHDPMAVKACRMAAQKCAADAAPFVHPKLANVAIHPEDEQEADNRRSLQRITRANLQGKTVQELGNLYLALTKGDEEELAAIIDQGQRTNEA